MKSLVLCVVALLATGAAMATSPAKDGTEHVHPHWSYRGKTSAKHWGDLQPDYATCKTGQQQSPVDIQYSQNGDLPAISFDYTSSALELVNNGHSIQANVASGGTIKLASGEYKLVQFHFHSPSEEKLVHKRFPMDAHLVHRSEDGKLAVVAVLFKLGKTDNPALAKVFATMPTEIEQKASVEAFNPSDLLPTDHAYYSYLGSLTTPPCTEGVQWQVLKTPVSISRAQLRAFQKLYPMNARPIQPLNGRPVQEG